jgi:hypothetical protein
MTEGQSRYVIGIDLGTTNSCVAYVDMEDPSRAVQLFVVPQMTAQGMVERKKTIPSFCYLSFEGEFAEGTLDMPWEKKRDYVVGHYAKERGGEVPRRLISSAKSWLCNAAAPRREKILPVQFDDAKRALSPLEATALYLRHIREAWDHAVARGDTDKEFDSQDVVVTVPASFDEVARTLTVEAATAAGCRSLTLLEEPQAAFYLWLAEDKNRTSLSSGDTVLVCDVGGGTTDFSLITVAGEGEEKKYQRMAVGDHLLLGGDNIDMALAHYIEGKMIDDGEELSREEWSRLQYYARAAKEHLLSCDGDEGYTITLQGSGSSLLAGSKSATVTKKEIETLIREGFFGVYGKEEALALRRSSGVRAVGLPYESEPSITKHCVSFLERNCGGVAPTHILFNGGTMKPEGFQDDVVAAIEKVYESAPTVVKTSSLDYAVAKGAACFAKTRRGYGTRVGGGIPRSYYLAVDVPTGDGIEKKGLTMLARGSEEGTVYEAEKTFLIKPNVPVIFDVLTSHVRFDDGAGDIVDINEEEFSRLAPLHTVVRFGKKKKKEAHGDVAVRLAIKLTEIGTLELCLKAEESDHTWMLQFQLKNILGHDDSIAMSRQRQHDETLEDGALQGAEKVIREVYDGAGKPQHIMRDLEEAIGTPREKWSPSILREIWKYVYDVAEKKGRSAEHESRWWNLAGYSLRPGFGVPLDDFRMKDIWKIILGEYRKNVAHDVMLQRLICYRRLAGGLNKGMQMQLAREVIDSVVVKKQLASRLNTSEYAEKIRLLGAFEYLDIAIKEKVGKLLIAKIAAGRGVACDYWTVGRMGARHMVYGSLGTILPVDACDTWIRGLLGGEAKNEGMVFALGMLSRETDHREINVSKETRGDIYAFFDKTTYKERIKKYTAAEACLSHKEQAAVVGDDLPAGLTLAY